MQNNKVEVEGEGGRIHSAKEEGCWWGGGFAKLRRILKIEGKEGESWQHCVISKMLFIRAEKKIFLSSKKRGFSVI